MQSYVAIAEANHTLRLRVLWADDHNISVPIVSSFLLQALQCVKTLH